MKKITVILALLFHFLVVSQSEKSMLWEISGNGLQKKSYLYGTMHVSDKVSYNLSDAFFDALLNSDIVANESNPETWGEVSVLMKDKEYLFSTQLYNSFNIKPLNKKDVLAIFTNKNHFFYNYLSLSDNQNADFEENAVLDMFISQAGRKYNKEITGLEDAVESMIPLLQIKSDEATPKEENLQLLYKILKRKSFGEATVDYYREKNITILDSIYKLAFSKKAHEALIINRNKIMVDSIASISKRGSLFAAVGAAHLAGNEGIIKLLKLKGFTVKPIFGQLTAKGEEQKKAIETYFKKPVFTTFTTSDSMIEVPLIANEITEEGIIGSPDYANGGLIQIIRKNLNYFIDKKNVFYNPKSLDSLFYENIPGTIVKKDFVQSENYSYYDIKNKTKTGNDQRYRFYITPLEIIMISMSGLNNYTSLFEDDVFKKIKIKEATNTWQNIATKNSSFTVKMPSYYTIRENDDQKSNSETIEAYLKEDNSFYFLQEKNLNDNETLEDTKFEHKQIHYQFYLQHDVDSTATNYDIATNTFQSQSTIGTKKIKLQSVISGNKYYLLGTINATATNSDTFFNSFEIKNNKYTNTFVTYTDTIANFKIKIPQKENKKLFLNLNSLALDAEENPLVSKSNSYIFKSPLGNTISFEYHKFHEYETITTLDSIKSFFRDYVLGKRDKINYYNNSSFYNENDEEYLSNPTSILNPSMYSKKGFDYSKWDILYNYESDSRILIEESEKTVNSTYTYEALVSTKKSNQAIKYKLVFDTNRFYTMQTLVPKKYKKSDAFIEEAYTSFELLPTIDETSIFNSKVQRFIEDASSKNDTLRKNAFASAYQLNLTEKEVNLITDFVANFEFKKSEFFAKNNLLKAIGNIKNEKVVPFLEKLYKEENATSENQISILIALSNQNTKESYKKIIALLEYDLPLSDNEYDISNMFYNFTRNQENAKELFPNIFQFYSIKEYQNPLLDFCYELLEKDLIAIKKIKAYQKMILTNAKLEYKRLKSWKTNNMLEEDEKEANDYYEENAPVEDITAFLNIIYKYPTNKDSEAFLSKIKELAIPELDVELLRLDFISNKLTDSEIEKALQNEETAFLMIQLLANKNRAFDLSNDQIATAALHNFYTLEKTDSIALLHKRIVDYNKERICFYFYTISKKEDISLTKTIRTIAFFMKGKELNPTAYTTFYSRTIEEEDDIDKKIEAIIKESLNAKHYRANYEKIMEGEMNANYLHDEF